MTNNPQLTHDRLGADFERVMNRYDLERRLAVLLDDFLGRQDLTDKWVLDAGCGTGAGTKRLIERGAKVIALDLGYRLVSYTSQRYHCHALQASALQLPFTTGTFDIVYSSEMIEHTPDPLACVQELIRVIKPGGQLVLSTPNWLWQFPVRVASLLKLRPYDGLENFVSPYQLRMIAQNQGGQVLAHQGIHILPFQIPPLHPFLRYIDRFGNLLLPIMINQAIYFQKAR